MGSKFIVFLPFFAISICGYFFPVSKNKSKPVFQPPDWFFGIIWTYITLSLGIVTNKFINCTKIKINDKKNILKQYLLLLYLLCYWLYLNYHKLEGVSFYLLVITCYLSIVYLIYLSEVSSNRLKKIVWYLLPLPFWLVLACCLNGVIYNNSVKLS